MSGHLWWGHAHLLLHTQQLPLYPLREDLSQTQALTWHLWGASLSQYKGALKVCLATPGLKSVAPFWCPLWLSKAQQVELREAAVSTAHH